MLQGAGELRPYINTVLCMYVRREKYLTLHIGREYDRVMQQGPNKGKEGHSKCRGQEGDLSL